MRALTVTHAFGDYAPGDQITDETAMAAALDTNPNSVVAVNLPEPAKASKAKASKAADSAKASEPDKSAS